jgi:UDP-N-acetylenolpyruvoylglucosamine reductase
MNAGAMQRSVFDIVDQVRCMDFEGQIHEFPAAEIPVVYRSCPMLSNQIALGAVFSGKPALLGQIDEKLNEYNQKRWKSQPAAPSAGCVFKNPVSTSAGRIIDELGLKGRRVGGAVVSDKHANFFVNNSGATARDIAILIDMVRLEVHRARNIWLQTEIQIIGEPDPPICLECRKEGV